MDDETEGAGGVEDAEVEEDDGEVGQHNDGGV